MVRICKDSLLFYTLCQIRYWIRIRCHRAPSRWSVYSFTYEFPHTSSVYVALLSFIYIFLHWIFQSDRGSFLCSFHFSLLHPGLKSFFFVAQKVLFIRRRSWRRCTSSIALASCGVLSRHTYTTLKANEKSKKPGEWRRNEKQFFFGVLKTIICLRNGIISWRVMVRCLNSPHDSILSQPTRTPWLCKYTPDKQVTLEMKYEHECDVRSHFIGAKNTPERAKWMEFHSEDGRSPIHSTHSNGKPFCRQHSAVWCPCCWLGMHRETMFVHVILIKTEIQ